tara:strand:- start:579 stop:1151 length:573 start_codon:yes stop_codon:yes gene_type:complete
MQRVVTSTLSTEIVRYSLDPEVVEPVVDFAVDTKYNVGNLKQSTNTKLHELPRFNGLFSRIQVALDDYRDLYQFQCDYFKPTLSWINVSEPHEEHHPHKHPNSFVSGILYLTNCSPTYFDSPAINAQSGICVISNHQMTYISEGVKGDLVLFPSYLEHYTLPGTHRSTLSFNAMPRGVVNKGTLLECRYD